MLLNDSGWRLPAAEIERSVAAAVLAALRPYAGAVLKEHQTEGPITVAVLEGAIRFKARGDERVLRCDGLLALGEAIQHECRRRSNPGSDLPKNYRAGERLSIGWSERWPMAVQRSARR